LIRAAVITGIALLVIVVTSSPVWQPRAQATLAPAAAYQFATAARPITAPQPIVARAAVVATPTIAARPPATPATLSGPPAGDLGRAADSYLNDLVGANLFQGAVLIARDGNIILSKGYGAADAGRGIPNTPRTRFRLASVTKQFTAAAIMLLQAAGKLDVERSICDYLANCPDGWGAITVRNLLTHTSGLPNYTDFGSYEETQMNPARPDDLVARFRDQPLLFAPGTSYMYENSDYVLLGVIVERVSGETYADFLRDFIFAPLQMRDSGVAQGTGGAAGEALGYLTAGEPAPPLDTSTLFSAGSVYSTVEDMYRWDQALYGTLLLPAPLLDAMWTPFMNSYGYGWRIDSVGSHRRISHSGLMDGFATSIARFPDDRVTIVVLSNMSAADVEGISNYLASLVLDS